MAFQFFTLEFKEGRGTNKEKENEKEEQQTSSNCVYRTQR